MRTFLRRHPFLIGLLVGLVIVSGLAGWGQFRTHAVAAAGPTAISVYGSAVDKQGQPGSWACSGGGRDPWLFGNRFGDASANAAVLALDTQSHDGYLVRLDSFIGQRYFKLFLYSPQYGDIFIIMPYDAVRYETTERPPTGRLDGRGDPQIAFNGGILKVFFTTWGGDGGPPDQGWRGYIFCNIIGREPPP